MDPISELSVSYQRKISGDTFVDDVNTTGTLLHIALHFLCRIKLIKAKIGMMCSMLSVGAANLETWSEYAILWRRMASLTGHS